MKQKILDTIKTSHVKRQIVKKVNITLRCFGGDCVVKKLLRGGIEDKVNVSSFSIRSRFVLRPQTLGFNKFEVTERILKELEGSK